MIRRMQRSLFVVGIAGGLLCQPVSAQEPVTGAADPEALFTSPDPKLHANKQVVLHIVRDLLQEGRWDEAPKHLTERYIQHNPHVPSGLDAVTKAFSSMPRRPIPKGGPWRMKVVSVVAEGDLVAVAIVRELPHPAKKGETYTTTWFDMWRIKDGKADEHWDGATLTAPPPGGAR
jgi:predicted SnoaL-like aldol condensation-catalyzing enzyme